MWAQTAVKVWDDDFDQVPSFVPGSLINLDNFRSIEAVRATDRNGQPLNPAQWQLVARPVVDASGSFTLLGQFDTDVHALAAGRALLNVVSIEGA